MQAGKALSNHAKNAIGHGKVISALFFSIPRAIMRAAFSGDIKKGMGKRLTSVSGVLIKPGHTTLTLIVPYNHPRKASPHALTQALDAE